MSGCFFKGEGQAAALEISLHLNKNNENNTLWASLEFEFGGNKHQSWEHSETAKFSGAQSRFQLWHKLPPS